MASLLNTKIDEISVKLFCPLLFPLTSISAPSVVPLRVNVHDLPEHLILQTEKADNNADDLVDNIINAGSVFIGAWAPESLGDYCSGTNHVLPTYGFARSYNGLSTSDFMQKITFQKVTPQGIRNIGQCAMTLAKAEGLDAHSRAVEVRLLNIQRSDT